MGEGFGYTVMPEDDIARLRAEVKRLRKAVTRKVSRIHVNTGIRMSGSPADPRRKATVERDMKESSLRDYAHHLAGFLDRGVQFVPDSQRRPMPRDLWRTYKSLEAQWNKRVEARKENIKDIFLPISGMTIGQREAMMRPDFPQLANPSVNPSATIERESRAVAGKSRLEGYIQQMRNRLEPDFFATKNEEGKEVFRKMADVIGDSELVDLVNELTEEQFEVVWHHTPFVTAMSFQYEAAMRDLQPEGARGYEKKAAEQGGRTARQLLEWVKGQQFNLD